MVTSDLKSRLSDASEIAPRQPIPIMPEYPAIADYPIDALDASGLSGIVRALQGKTQAPVALPAQSALAAAALAVQGFADVETLGGNRPLSLFCLTVAESGERKSSCDEPVMKPVEDFEKEQIRENAPTRQAWFNAKVFYDESLQAVRNKIKSGRASVADLNALGTAPVEPPSTDRLVTEPTFEGLTKLFATGQPSLGLFSDEGGQFLGGHAMSKDNAQKTLAALNNLWMAKPIKRTRSGDGSITLYGRRLSLHLMIQPVIADGLLADPLADGSGFLPRCLICKPPSNIGKRLHHNARELGAAAKHFEFRMRSILARKLPMDPETRALEPRTLLLAADARALLIDYSDEIEIAQAKGGIYEPIRGHASKSAEQAARIAGVLTLWHDIAATQVNGSFMADAIKLARFYLSEAARLANIATVSQETQIAEKLREWLCDSWPQNEVSMRDIQQRGPNVTRSSKPLRLNAIATLIDHGWLAVIEPDRRWHIMKT
ncbi:YfjI family protein [Sphingorhabdus contaminans]|uniref:DUF3987 domain-containing protein n=1 Tax=Sphingorhabdus contaminans TaxID=1343899 RepID=A0A553WIW5_9SPHN|nr:YfjI family protein [Sphingorhabdus contaminans]TSB04574.1 DUF3987 domain-containing protein [Sphingorhabdus contaminans]